MCEHEALPSGALFDIFSIWVSTLSKFSISIKLLSNEICIYFDALIKFKEFVYIYIWNALDRYGWIQKVMRKIGIKKTF